MHYTWHADPEIEFRIHNDLIFIREAILKRMQPQIHSILLVGAFGRGEGTVIKTRDGISVLSDYDIFITLKGNRRLAYLWRYLKFNRSIKRLAFELSHSLGIKNIDLMLKPQSYYRTSDSLCLEKYDVLNGHVLLWGSENPVDWMPTVLSSHIPLSEISRLLRNRGVGLLLAALYLDENSMDIHLRQKILTECHKAIIAMGDAYFILNHKYDSSYHQRLLCARHQSDTFFGLPGLREDYIQALHYKLSPDMETVEAIDLSAMWQRVVKQFEHVFRQVEQNRIGRPFQTWSEYVSLNPDGVSMRRLVMNTMGLKGIPRSVAAFRRLWVQSHSGRMTAALVCLLFGRMTTVSEPFWQRAGDLLLLPAGESVTRTWRELVRFYVYDLYLGTPSEPPRTEVQPSGHRSNRFYQDKQTCVGFKTRECA
jgi:hypothetical protein